MGGARTERLPLRPRLTRWAMAAVLILAGVGDALAVDLRALDRSMADRILRAEPAAPIVDAAPNPVPSGNEEQQLKATREAKALEARRQVVGTLDQLIDLPFDVHSVSYWINIEQMLKTLRAAQALEATWQLDSAPELLVNAVWNGYVDATLNLIDRSRWRPLNERRGDVLFGQWILPREGNEVGIIELYGRPADQALDWAIRNFQRRIDDPRSFVRSPDIVRGDAILAPRLAVFIDVSQMAPQDAEALAAWAAGWRADHVSVVVKNRDRAVGQCDAAMQARLSDNSEAMAAPPGTSQETDPAVRPAPPLPVARPGDTTNYRQCLEAAGDRAYAGQTLVFDPNRRLQVEFVASASLLADFQAWSDRISYLANRWPQ